MFLLRFTGHSGLSTVPTIQLGLRENIKSTGREFRRVRRGQSFAFEQPANGDGEESGQFSPWGGIRAVGRIGLYTCSPGVRSCFSGRRCWPVSVPLSEELPGQGLEMTEKGWRGRQVVNCGRWSLLWIQSVARRGRMESYLRGR